MTQDQPGAYRIAQGEPNVGARLSPVVATWFERRFREFSEAQQLCIPRILARESVLLSSPTGSGKTLAAFLGIIDDLVRETRVSGPARRCRGRIVQDPSGTAGRNGRPPDSAVPGGPGIHAIYVSPLRALTYDLQKNLQQPLAEMGLDGQIRVAMRTSDTPAGERRAIRRHPPEILLITPESLAIILCQNDYRESLRGCRYVVIDELHAIAENKRGVDLALSMERLEALCERPLCRVGLSATVAPLERMAAFLVGPRRACWIANAQVARRQVIEVFSPVRKQPYPPAGFSGTRILEEAKRLVEKSQSVLVFCNTRSGAENIGLRLKQLLPELAGRIEIHHSSLDRSVRLQVEDRLKNGELRAVVCSTSLEMGIDVGAIDLVIMVSTPKGISRTLQRLGRAGHSIHQTSYGVLVATNINDLIECVVTARLTRERRLDPVRIPELCWDVIAQHVVGMAMAAPMIHREEVLAVLRRAWPCRALTAEGLEQVLTYLQGGGRRLSAQYADVFGKIVIREDRISLPSRRVEREYLMNVGTIPAEGVITVFLGRQKLGQLEEGFIKRLNLGDRFVLAGRIVQLVETNACYVKVKAAGGKGPIVPSWNAGRMPLTSGIAQEVVRFRTEINRRLDRQDPGLLDWLVETEEISASNAEAIIAHFQAQRRFSRVPVERLLLIECYQGEDGLLNYFFHSLIGRSGNDALSRIISYRMKQVVGGNAMVTVDDYGFLLSLQPFQRMTLPQLRQLIRVEGAAEALERALRDSELVRWQFRGVAQTGLMVPRNRPGGERRLRQIRWNAEILFRVLQEHEPDHPLLQEAYRQAEYTFLDAERAFAFLDEAPGYEWDLREVPAVSPFALGMYVSQIREAMLHESPEEAIERLYHQMYGNE
ncbi:MAG: DEAD/DEAH box helicase [Verrucomicrobia bacterium]|nr:DEAD/DEAH box helicase [Verrucomicrobiota bacterium]